MTPSTAAEASNRIRAVTRPDPHTPGAIATQCRSCPAVFWRWAGAKTRHCETCAYRRQVEGTDGISRKQGPAWEATVRGQLKRWTLEAELLGLTTPTPGTPSTE